MSEQDADQTGTVVASKITEVNAALEAFRDQLIDVANFSSYILHNEVEAPDPQPAPSQIGSFILDPLVSTQRRRLRG